MKYRLLCLLLVFPFATAARADSESATSPADNALSFAIHKGNSDAVLAAIEAGADVNVAFGEDRETPLHQAARQGLTEIVSLLIKAGAEVDPKTKEGITPLVLAAEEGHKNIVELLRARGAEYSIHSALFVDDVETGRKMIESDASLIESKDRYGYRPLHLAARGGHLGLVRYLIEKGANVNATENAGFGPLFFAAREGHVETVLALLDAGARVGVQGSDFVSSSPLHAAAEGGHREVVELLLEHGAPVEAKDLREMTPLDVAAVEGHEELVDLLVLAGAEYSISGAAAIGDASRVEELLDADPGLIQAGTTWGDPLIEAAGKGHLEVVKLLLERGADPNRSGMMSGSPLLNAVSGGHREVVELLLDHGADVNQISTFVGLSPVHIAVMAENSEMLELLLKRGGDPNVEGMRLMSGMTPLHSAAMAGNRKMAEILLAHGADPTVKSDYFATPAQFAEAGDHAELAEFLMDAEREFEQKNPDIHEAVASGNIGTVRRLLEKDPTLVKAKDTRKREKSQLLEDSHPILGESSWIATENTPLHVAAEKGHDEIASLLIARGAVVDATNARGQTALHVAAEEAHLLLAERLVEAGANVTATGEWDYTPLHGASEAGHAAMVDFLLSKGADPNPGGGRCVDKPLELAAAEGHRKVVEILLDAGAEVNPTEDDCLGTPLIEATKNNHREIAELLIARGADVNALELSFTPLHYAAMKGNKEMVGFLVSKGALVNATGGNNFGGTPLYQAASQGHLEIARFLISQGADTTIANDLGETPLHEAAMNGHKQMAEFLLSVGADPAVKDADGFNALHKAAFSGRKAVIAVMLEQGLDINENENKFGFTPLMCGIQSIEGDELAAAQFLIEQGAKVNALTRDGTSALHIASFHGFKKDMVNLLIEHGADPNVQTFDRGLTPLHTMILGLSVPKVAEALLEGGADPNIPDILGYTPLDYARKKGELLLANLLLDYGAKEKVGDSRDVSTDETD